MGCWYSKSPSKSSLNISENESRNVYSWDLKPQIDPKDFIIENVQEQTVVRLPQTVNGQQFIVQNCHESTVLVLDYINTVTVDDCSDCTILLGPIQGSLFVRDCHRSRIMAACQQFRARDCSQLEVFLCVPTQPIIESCADIRFGCYSCFYPALKEQFQKANLSIFNNQWYHVYDFTPLPAERNWSLLDRDVDLTSFCPKVDDPTAAVETAVSLVPWTPLPFSLEGLKKTLALIFHDAQAEERAMRILSYLGNKSEHRTSLHSVPPPPHRRILGPLADDVQTEKSVLLRTMQVQLEPHEMTNVMGLDGLSHHCKKGPVIAILFAGGMSPEVYSGIPPTKAAFMTNAPKIIDNFLMVISQKGLS